MSNNHDEKHNVPKKSILKETFKLLVFNFFEHNVGKSAAGLAYYLLFALFPFTIFLFNFLGLMDLDIYSITHSLHQVLPDAVLEVVEGYMDYISHTSSHTLMWFALVFSIWFPMRAAKGLMDDVRRAYGQGLPGNLVKYTVRQLIYTVVLLVVIVLTLGLTVIGERILFNIIRLLNSIPDNTFDFSGFLINSWQYIRFIPAGLLMLLAIGTLYGCSADGKQPIRTILPGMFGALILWLVVSMGFSFYVENFAKYTVIYGTLGAVIVLMVWLYLTALILIMGAEFNAALQKAREECLKTE